MQEALRYPITVPVVSILDTRRGYDGFPAEPLKNREIVVAGLVLTILPKMPNPGEFDRFSGVILDFDRNRTFCGAGLGSPVVKRVAQELTVAGLEAVNRVAVGGRAGAGYEDEPVPSEQSRALLLRRMRFFHIRWAH